MSMDKVSKDNVSLDKMSETKWCADKIPKVSVKKIILEN